MYAAIIEQQPVLDKHLILDSREASSTDFTILQLAAREGRLNTVIELIALNEKIDEIDWNEEKVTIAKQSHKTPFLLAVEYGHLYLAEVLLALGADKKLAIEIAETFNQRDIAKQIEKMELRPHIVCALAFWIVNKEFNDLTAGQKTRILEQLKPQLQRVDIDGTICNGLIELSLQTKEYSLARNLLSLRPNQTLRANPAIRTAGYWAAKLAVNTASFNPNDFFTNDDAFLIMLQQLQADNHKDAVKHCLRLATETVKAEFEKQPQLELKSDAVLTETQEFIYNLAAKGDIFAVDLFAPTRENSITILRHALEKKNFVAIGCLLKALKSIELLNAFLTGDEFELAQLCFFNFNLSATLALPGIVLGIENFPKLLKTFSSPAGYAHQLISSGLRRNALPSEELVEFAKQLLPDSNSYLRTVIRCIQDRYELKSLSIVEKAEDISKNKKSALRKRKHHNIILNTDVSVHDFSLLKIMLARFEIRLKQGSLTEEKKSSNVVSELPISPFNKLPGKLWEEIIPFLSGNTLKGIPSVSQDFQEYKLHADEQEKFGMKWQLCEELQREFAENEEKFISFAKITRLLRLLVDNLNEQKPGIQCSALFKLILLDIFLVLLASICFYYASNIENDRKEHGYQHQIGKADDEAVLVLSGAFLFAFTVLALLATFIFPCELGRLQFHAAPLANLSRDIQQIVTEIHLFSNIIG